MDWLWTTQLLRKSFNDEKANRKPNFAILKIKMHTLNIHNRDS